MRLSKIKLAGFKSFVDPTAFSLNTNLTGVIGPNGCGKSNVIDAVRWVLGESSAKHLRGGGMADVVFNGSQSRKPVGQASVELVFDNSDGSVGGEFARFNELVIRRAVNRDGQSSYFLNGTRCRRRDITDLFLGTGLGPRSYAIIEQGMISRIIDAKPEELRNYVEEAAGISKYKERRRETENRIRHSRDNLERLNDLIEEVDKQLQRLDRQAKTAKRFKDLKEQQRHLDGRLLLLRLQALSDAIAQARVAVDKGVIATEAAVADQRRCEREIESARDQHVQLSDQLNETQAQFYEVGAEIARLEQAIDHAKSLQSGQREQLRKASEALEDLVSHQALDRTELADHEQFLREQEPRLEQFKAQEQAQSSALAQADQRLRDWQKAWENAQQAIAKPAQQAEVQRNRAEQLQRQLRQHEDRLQRLAQEKQGLDTSALQAELADLDQQGEALEGRQAGLETALSAAREATLLERESSHELARRLDEQRRQAQSLTGRLASLKALQDAALAQDDKAARRWVAGLGLADAPRLAALLTVARGWERALEVVLAEDLQALALDSMGAWAERFKGPAKASLTVFDRQAEAQSGHASEGGVHRSGLPRLSTLLEWDEPNHAQLGHGLLQRLSKVLAAEDLAQALAVRELLAADESVVTRDGLWLAADWLRMKADSDPRAGVLQRGQQIRELGHALSECEASGAALGEQLSSAREALAQAEQAERARSTELAQLAKQLASLRATQAGRHSRLEQLQARLTRIDEELLNVRAQAQADAEAAQQAEQERHQALAELEGLTEARDRLAGERSALEEAVQSARHRLRELRQQQQSLSGEVQARRSSAKALKQSLQRVDRQLESHREGIEVLEQSLSDLVAPLAEQGERLQQQLAQRSDVEQRLNQERARLGEVEAQIREWEQGRFEAEDRVEKLRDELEKARLHQQELSVRATTLEEALEGCEVDRQSLLEGLDDGLAVDVAIEQAEAALAEVSAKLARLGAINLAAIDEFKEQSERKGYLDAQHADLTEALETLEAAIRKIDKQTRSRFADTFDRVNAKLQELFPKLFGGGHAYLELTDDDLLHTGITIMARPPGKKNASIQLLSGGEKALTAVALVFAFFELNPAPFCMLDEVDAPLDDANVGRFSAMVKAMSERVQFVFISHNKGTMEIADELLGVTMHELGVSRLVSVDVEEAVRLAEA